MPSSASTYPPKLAELVETLGLLDRGERIDALIGLADRFEEVPAEVARRPFPEKSKVPACESDAYVFPAPRRGGGLDLHFAVENPQGLSAKAMAVILKESLEGEDPASYAELSAELPLEIFGRELSMGKNMGLMGMVAMVAHAARQQTVASEAVAKASPRAAP
jgi:cysteine desulfuration protein SufE